MNKNDLDPYWYDIDLHFTASDDGEEEMCLSELLKTYCNTHGISLSLILWLVKSFIPELPHFQSQLKLSIS